MKKRQRRGKVGEGMDEAVVVIAVVERRASSGNINSS